MVRLRRGEKSADFHRIVSWKLAELCVRHLRKKPVFVEGRLTNRSYEGADKTPTTSPVVLSDLHILRFEQDRKTVNTQDLAEQVVQPVGQQEVVAEKELAAV